MRAMREETFTIDDTGRRLAWTEWGERDNPAMLLCVHGLTRSGRDFDRLAPHFADAWRVVCIDVAGRGRSDPLPPERYGFHTYAADVAMLMEHLKPATLDWIGTSMGGIISLIYATSAKPPAPPIRRLVLNDVGPEIPDAALERIGDYVGRDWRFTDAADAEEHLREVYAPFAFRSDEDWRWFVEMSVSAAPDGGYVPRYDPRIGEAFRNTPKADPAAGWALWDMLTLPVLVVQGEESDVLPDRIAEAMERRGPCARRHIVPRTGHAPPLIYPDEIGPIEAFLREPPLPGNGSAA